jgi:hypothetical protein
MSPMPWFRVYSEIMDDKKLRRIYRATEFSKVEVIGVWICLLSLANECEDRGSLLISKDIPYELIDLSAETGMPEDELGTLLELFEKYNMLQKGDGGWEIKNWDGRQFKSDDVSIRVQKHREKKRKQSDTVKRYGNVIDTDTDTDSNTDSESELDQSAQTDSLFDSCMEIYQTKKGRLVTDGASFSQMIKKFKDQGVTAEDYAAAIDAQDANPKYRGTKPTSYENYAIGIAQARNSENDPKNQGKTNEELIREWVENDEI